MPDEDHFERAADGLCEVTLAMEDVDLNALVDEDAREFLDIKKTLQEMTLRYRRGQHTTEKRREECEIDV